MSETLITAMLILQSDGRLTRSLDEYLSRFSLLVETGRPIVLYLDPSLIVIRNAPRAQARIRSLDRFPADQVIIPGHDERGGVFTDRVNRRF